MAEEQRDEQRIEDLIVLAAAGQASDSDIARLTHLIAAEGRAMQPKKRNRDPQTLQRIYAARKRLSRVRRSHVFGEKVKAVE